MRSDMGKKPSNRKIYLYDNNKLIAEMALGSIISSCVEAGLNFQTSASSTGICATCSYWGGVRKISTDGEIVISQSLGWCNNPNSHYYQNTTSPESGLMKNWCKWDVLE